MNAAGNLITFLSAPVSFRRQCRSQQHFLLILQVAQKMSNSPPEGLMRAFHLSHKTLFGHLEGSLMVFSSISDSMSIPFSLLTRLYHTPRAESWHKLPAHLPTPPENQICSPRSSLHVPFLLLCLSWVSLETTTHLAALMGKSIEGWRWENSLFPLIMSCAEGEGNECFKDKVLTYKQREVNRYWLPFASSRSHSAGLCCTASEGWR